MGKRIANRLTGEIYLRRVFEYLVNRVVSFKLGYLKIVP